MININSIFNEVFNGNLNFLTPCVLKRGKRKEYLYELSTDFERYMFGVTVLREENDGWKNYHEAGKGFTTQTEAEEYIKELKTLNKK